MKNIFLTTLRNKKTKTADFRWAAYKLATLLASEAAQYLEKKKTLVITPTGKTRGTEFKNDILLIPILRAGLALLPSFLQYFPEAKVGFFGLKRDETTFKPKLYYQNIPKTSKNTEIIILDPMIATGGSVMFLVKQLLEQGVKENKIVFVAVVASPTGLRKLKKSFPKMKVVLAVLDKGLNKQKYIVPGLGDFGDRYFKS